MAERPLYPVPRKWRGPLGPPPQVEVYLDQTPSYARRFDGLASEIRTSIGGSNLNAAFTIAALVRRRQSGATLRTLWSRTIRAQVVRQPPASALVQPTP